MSIKEKVAKLINVKTIVTLSTTGAFVFLSVTGKITSDLFMSVFVTIVAFYFGVQSTKGQE